jgi:T5SS/PEP-CTERM-associated repeat protein
VNVDGLNSKLSNTKDLYIGDGGIGALNITNRGQVTNFNGNLGVQNGSMGTVSVDGAGSLWKNDSVVAVGILGSGILNVTSGGAVTSTNGRIARESGSSGMVSVTGSGSSWTASGDLSVGNSGAGTLAIQNGGRVTNFNGNIGVNGPIGIFAAADGKVTVSGAGSQWINNSVVAVGVNGRGMLSILDGGRVQSTNGFVGREAGSAGTVLIDGPGSRWDVNGDLTMGLTGTGTASLEVRNGGVLSAAGIMMIGSRGTLRGDGTIVADVFNAGTVAPGTSPGTLLVNGNFQQSVGGRLQIELAAASFDKLDVTGEITLDNTLFGPPMGGTLDVSLVEDFVPYGTQSFDILDWSGSLSGTFTSIQLPTLGGTLVWDTSQLYINGTLSVTGPALPAGDFNDDGLVDAADYVVWRNEIGTPVGYEMWRANFGAAAIGSGATVGRASSVNAAVPESASFALLLTGLTAMTLNFALRQRPRLPNL